MINTILVGTIFAAFLFAISIYLIKIASGALKFAAVLMFLGAFAITAEIFVKVAQLLNS